MKLPGSGVDMLQIFQELVKLCSYRILIESIYFLIELPLIGVHT